MHFTSYSDPDSFEDRPLLRPGMTCVEARVLLSGAADDEAGHSVFSFLHHIACQKVAPVVVWFWESYRGALQPQIFTNVHFSIFKINDL